MQDRAMDSVGKGALLRWGGAARGAIALATLCGVVAAVANIALAWSLATGISSAIAGIATWDWLAWGAAAVALRSGAGFVGERASSRAALAIIDAARTDIGQAIARRGAGVLLNEAAGARVSQIVDRTALLAGWASRWKPGSRLAAIVPVLILAAVATQSWVSTVLLAGSVIVLPVFLWLTTTGTRAVAARQQASLDALSGAFQERTEHAGLIRAFRAIGRETERLQEASVSLKRSTMRVLRVAFLSTAVLEFFAAISIALLAVYIGFKLLGLFPFETGETVTLQEGMMVLILAPEFFAPIRRMATLHHDRADAVSAADMLGGWLAAAAPERIRAPALARAPVISFTGVAIARGGGVVLRDLSFEALPGRITALWGASGSGKTSCLLHLLGLAERTEGVVRIDAEPLAMGASLADSVAYIRQAPWMIEGTLADNLRVGRADARDEDLLEALTVVGAAHLASAEAGGLQRAIGRGGQGLSGGERQRIALARALLRKVRLWLLDEPTAHLDSEAETQVIALLRKLAAGRTIIIATHSDAVRQASDTVVAIPSRGSLAA